MLGESYPSLATANRQRLRCKAKDASPVLKHRLLSWLEEGQYQAAAIDRLIYLLYLNMEGYNNHTVVSVVHLKYNIRGLYAASGAAGIM
jgi:hypothetical protein